MNIHELILLLHGQPPIWVGGLGALIFLIIIVVSLMIGYMDEKRHKKVNWDLFEIGYILDPKENSVASTPVIEVEVNSELRIDCILALVAIGYKKTEAKKIAEKVFASKDITSVEQFLVEANRRPT